MCAQIRRIVVPCLLLVAFSGVLQTAAAQTEANKAVVERWLALWNTQDLAIADEVFAADFVPHSPHFPYIADLESYKAEIAKGAATIPDFHATLEDVVAEGNMVAARFTATGTAQGEPIVGVLVDGVPYMNTWIIMFRFGNDKIVEEWWQMDLLGVLEQLGVMPPTRHDYSWGVPSEVTGDPGDPEANRALLQRFVEEIMNQQDFDLADELFAAGYVMHTAASPVEVLGPEGLKQMLGMYAVALPDAQVTIEDTVAEGDKVAFRFTMTGTHNGELMGIPPTGRQITMKGNSIHRFAGGKFAETWACDDVLGMMQQLTAPPAWPLEGAWINTIPIPEMGVIMGEWTVVRQDPSGTVFTSEIRAVKPDPTIFGYFPDADHETDHIGRTEWTASLAYESTWVGYGTKVAELPGQLPEIVYISVLNGRTQFIDRNTLKGEGTHAFYLPSQDADGDGFPDEGQEPVACFPYASTSKRVQLMPACVPPPPEGE
jgi:steroid delta-isomerase-like uncharacterized protein